MEYDIRTLHPLEIKVLLNSGSDDISAEKIMESSLSSSGSATRHSAGFPQKTLSRKKKKNSE
jgi:hypothetical protein